MQKAGPGAWGWPFVLPGAYLASVADASRHALRLLTQVVASGQATVGLSPAVGQV